MLTTALNDWHIENGAKMVSFAGYQMPVQYTSGVLQEHLHARQKAGFFDVSHMGQLRLIGQNVTAALELLLPADLQELPVGKQTLSILTNEQGGIRDDLMVVNCGDHVRLIVNAACKRHDIAYLMEQLPSEIQIDELKEHALFALQGPMAQKVLAAHVENIEQYKFMDTFEAQIDGVDCFISRSGYSGEDGFEISCHNNDAVKLANFLNASQWVEPIGLGARDSLRLEAGLCLYGHDLTQTTSPVEANLKWLIARTRRSGERANFKGAEVILQQLENGAQKQRVGLDIEGRAPVREGVPLLNADSKVVGEVSSGGFSPSLKKPIAMAYVESSYSSLKTQLFAQVRKKLIPVTVQKLPFIEHNYYR